MSVLRTAGGLYLALCAVFYVVTLTFWAVTKVRLALYRWQGRRLDRQLLVFEAQAITEIAARVRADVPPITAEYLAECVSEALERQKDMGL